MTSEPATTTADRLKNGLGVFLVVFVAALNFLGLRDAEVASVLRNSADKAALTGGLMLLAVGAAVTAVVVPDHTPMRPYYAPPIFAACIGLASVVICFINNPLTQPGAVTADCSTAVWASAGLFLGAATIGIVWRSRWLRQTDEQKRPHWDLVSVLVVCAVLLTSVATFSAGRLEAESQLTSSYPQVSATMKHNGTTEDLAVTVSGSKLANGDKIGVIVQGIPHDSATFNLMQMCPPPQRLDSCLEARVCNTIHASPCEVLASHEFEPSSTGEVTGTVELPVTNDRYQFIDVRAQICELDGPTAPPTPSPAPAHVAKKAHEPCYYQPGYKLASAFLRVPPSDPTASPR
ncbi:hypothetical protein ACIRRH_30915 [Kitasatospora sp. NPDC101235]|uniref:hypothetical protein n=1 Tax=Kitasatospora sp. NPDC101235 TaxID=3364101 RepID=UPI003814171C